MIVCGKKIVLAHATTLPVETVVMAGLLRSDSIPCTLLPLLIERRLIVAEFTSIADQAVC